MTTATMRIDILSVVPRLMDSFFAHSILKRAVDKGLAEVHLHDIRDYATGKNRQVDNYAFGGGAGVVLQIEPIARCIRKLQSERSYDEVIYLTPDGERLAQSAVNQLYSEGEFAVALWSLQRCGPTRAQYVYYQRNKHRRLRTFRRGVSRRRVGRRHTTPRARGAERRNLGPYGLVSGQLAGAAGLYPTFRL